MADTLSKCRARLLIYVRAYRFSNEELAEAVANSTSYAQVLRTLGVKWSGSQQGQYVRRIAALGLDVSHFKGQGHNRGKRALNRLTTNDIFVMLPEGSTRTKSHLLRRALLESGVTYRCAVCFLTEWSGQPLVLEVDHKNNNWFDNRQENLQFLCPNCHSQKSIQMMKSEDMQR